MNKFKTAEEIAAEVIRLEDCKTYVPKLDGAGNNDHTTINAQISALRIRMEEDGALNLYGDEPDRREAVLAAIYWRTGESEYAPSTGWDDFKPKS